LSPTLAEPDALLAARLFGVTGQAVFFRYSLGLPTVVMVVMNVSLRGSIIGMVRVKRRIFCHKTARLDALSSRPFSYAPDNATDTVAGFTIFS
jgi:hypothetical protein